VHNIVQENYKNLISKILKGFTCNHNTRKAGFEAYLVGGCVRDLLMSQILNGVEANKEPKDWDVTLMLTKANYGSFRKTVYENTFGTVGVCLPIQKDVSYETHLDNVSREHLLTMLFVKH